MTMGSLVQEYDRRLAEAFPRGRPDARKGEMFRYAVAQHEVRFIETSQKQFIIDLYTNGKRVTSTSHVLAENTIEETFPAIAAFLSGKVD